MTNKPDKERIPYVTRPWSRTILQPLLITLSVISLFTGVVSISQAFGTATRWMPFVWLFILVSLEGIYTTLWLDDPKQRNLDRLAYRAAEVLIIVLMVRFFTWAVSGEWPQFRLLRNYLLSPLALVDDPFFVVGAVVTVMAWERATSLSRIFTRLAIDQAEASYYTVPARLREPGSKPVAIDRSQLVIVFFQQWIGGAVILMICTAITTFDLSNLSDLNQLSTVDRLELQPELFSALMIYFLSGLLLLSQARLAAMNARWLIADMNKDESIERSWHRNSVWLVLIIAVLAAFLPVGSTFAAGHIVEVILWGLFLLLNLLMAVILAILTLLSPRLFGGLGTGQGPMASAPPPTVTPGASSEIIAIIISSLFWAVIIFVTVTAVVFFLRDRGIVVRKQWFKDAWIGFLGWIRGLWKNVSDQVEIIRQATRARKRVRTEHEKKRRKSPWPLLRVNALSPRRQLRYYYLSIVRRAGGRGIKRRQSETPLEYARQLKGGWPDTEEDVEALTIAFLRARYSRHEIREEVAEAARGSWKRLKSSLRRGPTKKEETAETE